MKRAITILTCVLAAAAALAQNPQIIQNTKAIMQGVQANETRATNQALGLSGSSVSSVSVSKPSPASPNAAPRVNVAKPAAAAKSAAVPTKAASVAAKTTPAVVVKTIGSKPATAKPVAKVVPVVAPVAAKPAAPASAAAAAPAKTSRTLYPGSFSVVTNSMNKAYFLRENDPVFNGYVVKITSDSIVFQETMQDRLGKTFTKEVVKKLTTPAV